MWRNGGWRALLVFITVESLTHSNRVHVFSSQKAINMGLLAVIAGKQFISLFKCILHIIFV